MVVCTIDNTNILPGEYQVLPKNKLLYVTLEFDGKIEIRDSNRIITKITIKGGETYPLGVEFGHFYKIYE
jgi:hypothetical protein